MSESLLNMYMRAALAEKTEVPDDYHFWSCLSAIASCLQDRVWMYRFGKQIPNMYTFLIGDSASGKGAAIKIAEEMISGIDIVNASESKGSAQGLLDILSKKEANQDGSFKDFPKDAFGRIIDPEKAYVITPELKDGIGVAGQAESFISMATNIWEGAKPISQIEYTRNGGEVHILVAPCLNWLAGTTKKWLMESLSVSALQGGFIGRTACIIPKDYTLDKRVYDYEYPEDYNALVKAIKTRFMKISWLNGEFTLTEEANKVFKNWYEHRSSPPIDSPIAPVWKRLPQMVCKMGMLLSASNGDTMQVTGSELNQALGLCAILYANAQAILAYANVTPKTEIVYRMATLLKEHKQLPQARLIQMLSVTYDDYMQALQTLLESSAVERISNNHKYMIKWLGSKGWL